MTRKHAQFIADLVPGAKAFIVGPASYVYVAKTPRVEIRLHSPIAGCEVVILDGNRSFRIDMHLAADFLATLSEFNSAIAAATAAGFPEGKQGEDRS